MFGQLFDRITQTESQLTNRFDSVLKGFGYDLSECVLSTSAINANSRSAAAGVCWHRCSRTDEHLAVKPERDSCREGFVFPTSGSRISLSQVFPSVKDWSI